MKGCALLILTLLAISTGYANCSVQDDLGHLITVPHPAKRVISLAPHITELLAAIDGLGSVVGVMAGSDYPPAATQIRQIGTAHAIDLETILSLQPDLIVTWGPYFSRQLRPVNQMGIPVYTSDPRILEDIPRSLRHLGCLLGREKSADREAIVFEQRLAQLKGRYQTKHRLRTFYQIGSYSLFTINKNSWINQIISLCGGENIFAHAKSLAPQVAWEAVVRANPQVILSDATNPDWKRRWQAWPTLSAVAHQNLFAIPPDLIDRPSPRLLLGAAQACEFIAQARQKMPDSTQSPN